jgi:inorganic pyrophosphatase
MMSFWTYLDELIASSEFIVARPRCSQYLRYPEYIYPLDFGYLEGTKTTDGDGLDFWLGSIPDCKLGVLVLTVDLVKRITEIKLLLGCTPEENQTVLDFHNMDTSRAYLVPRPSSKEKEII